MGTELDGCGPGSPYPNGDGAADVAVSVTSHELMESVTDPEPPSGWVDLTDPNGGEIADKCLQMYGPRNADGGDVTFNGHDYLVQKEWSNAISGCTMGTQAPPPTFNLSVMRAGSGLGTVTSAPAGISCGATCSAPFAQGTTVTLTAVPNAGSTFAGWSGACSGTGACVVTMNAATAVTATFNVLTVSCSPRPPVMVSVTPAGAGRLQVTIGSTGLNNTLRSIQFGNPAANPALPVNSLIDIGSLVGASGGFTFPAPVGATQVTFYLRRSTAGASTTPLVVTDGCGAWPTLVGGGAGSF